NGTQVAREEARGGPKPTLEFDLHVPLTEGKNVLLVTAVDGSGDRRQEARVVMRGPASAVPRTGPPGRGRPGPRPGPEPTAPPPAVASQPAPAPPTVAPTPGPA